MTTPTFSVILPTYNRREWVGSAIESVLLQTLPDFELIVSDNYSTDDTRDVVASYDDPRLRYVQPPEHCAMPIHWEFVRSQARGELIVFSGDDDAMIPSALERFLEAHRRHGADFIFSSIAEYLAPGFSGPNPNSIVCLPYTTRTSVITAGDLLGSLFSELQPKYRMDPNAFVFSRALSDRVVARAGHFFNTQGAEYFAWPLAAAMAERIAHISLPLVIVGRTPKSWGTNMVLTNPGTTQIDTLKSDTLPTWTSSPFTNHTFANLMVEGMMAAKDAAPDALDDYPLNERAYVTSILRELESRRAKGVDVDDEVAEVLAYVKVHPSAAPTGDSAGDAGVRDTVEAVVRRAQGAAGRALKHVRPLPKQGFKARGEDYGFVDIVGAARFIEKTMTTPFALQREVRRTH